MTPEEIKAFGRGFKSGMDSVYAVLDDIKKRYFFVPKWIWIATVITSFAESAVLIWHLLKDK